MSVATLKGIISIDKTLNVINCIDNTDWAGQGFNLGVDGANLYYKLTATTSGGVTVIYDNLAGPTPDIVVLTAGQQFQISPQVPTGMDGDVLQGTWLLEIRAEISDANDYEVTGNESYLLNYEWPSVCIKTQVFCDTSQVQSDDITDYGVYATNITRTHTLFPPPASGATPKITPLPVNVYGPNIWSKTWTAQVISVVTFTMNTNFVVIKQIDNAKEFEVVCSKEICSVMCCVTRVMKKYDSMAIKKGVGEARGYWASTVEPAIRYAMMFLLNQNCGRAQKAAEAVAALKEITGCGDCDECGDDEPVIVLPTAPAENLQVIVDSPLGSITVTPEVISSIQYFHIEVSQAIQTILNQFKAQEVISLNSYLQVTSTTAPDGHVIWQLLVIENLIIKSLSAYTLKVYPNPVIAVGQPLYLIDSTPIKVQGQWMKAATFGIGSDTPNVAASYGIIDVTDFLSNDGTPLIEAHAQVMRYTATKDEYTLVKDIECEIFWIDIPTSTIRLRLYSPVDGSPLQLSDLASKGDIYISLMINAQDL